MGIDKHINKGTVEEDGFVFDDALGFLDLYGGGGSGPGTGFTDGKEGFVDHPGSKKIFFALTQRRKIGIFLVKEPFYSHFVEGIDQICLVCHLEAREEDLQTQIIHSNGEFSHRGRKERTPTHTFSENKGRRNTFHLIS